MDASRPHPTSEVLLEHASWVRRLAVDLVGDPAAAEDVAQETWLAFLRQRPDSDRSLRPWLARVVRNRAALRLRRRTNRRAREADVARGEAVPSADELAERAEVQRRVVDAVLALDEPYRETLLLRYYEGLTPKQIGESRGIAPGTVRTHLYRAHEVLRDRLDEDHGERRAWAAMLVPLTVPARAPVALASRVGAWLVGLLAVGAVCAVAWMAWRTTGVESDEVGVARYTDIPETKLAVVPRGATDRSVAAMLADGTREVTLLDAKGRVLADYSVEVDGATLRSNGKGVVSLPIGIERLVPVDDSRLRVDAMASHDVRVLRAFDRPAVAVAPDAGELVVPAGPSFDVELVASRRIDVEELEARLVASGLSPYSDDGRPRQVAPVRARAPTRWIRFGEVPSGADDPRAAWTLEIRSRDGLVHGAAPVADVTGADRVSVAVRLEPTAALEGAVSDGSGLALAGAPLVLLARTPEAPLVATAAAGADGRYALRWVPPGDYTLRSHSPRHEPWSRDVTVAAGERTALDVALVARPPGGRLAGAVTSDSGTHEGQLLVVLLDGTGQLLDIEPTTWRDVDGTRVAAFDFADAPGGAIALDVVSLADAVTFEVRPQPLAAPCSTVDVRLRDARPSSDIAFRVTDAATGAELHEYSVEVSVEGGAPRRFLAAMSGADGQDAPVRVWTLVVAGMRWNTFGGAAPLRALPDDAPFTWTVRAAGYTDASGDRSAVLRDSLEGRSVTVALNPN